MDNCLASNSETGGVGCDNMTMVIIALLNGKTKDEWYKEIGDRVAAGDGPCAPPEYGKFLFQSKEKSLTNMSSQRSFGAQGFVTNSTRALTTMSLILNTALGPLGVDPAVLSCSAMVRRFLPIQTRRTCSTTARRTKIWRVKFGRDLRTRTGHAENVKEPLARRTIPLTLLGLPLPRLPSHHLL
jgi:hypothetical protein